MKKLAALFLLAVVIMALCGCNKQIVDTTYRFNRAIIFTTEGVIVDGSVQSWKDFDDGDQIQVKINGKTYLTHSSNVILIAN